MFSQTLARTAFSFAGATLFAATCLVAGVAPATATAVSTTVSTADLNLANKTAQATRDGRVKAAARAMCGVGGSDLASRRAEKDCTRAALMSRK